MRWTRSEQQTIEDLLESLGLPTSLDPIGLLPRPPSTLDRLRDDLLRPSEEDTTRRGLKSLRSFAHFIGVDVNEEFWELKCLLVALHEHPYFGRKGKADGRLRNLAVAEADLFEWWIEAWSLRAKLEFQRGKPVTDAELGVEMALRSRGLRDLDPDSLGSKEADEIESAKEYYLKELARRRKEFGSLMARHSFKLPSMRPHARKHTPGLSDHDKLKWGLSETEMEDKPQWLPIFQRLRDDMKEQARKKASR